jgi:phosphoribosylglycinamide formyltransferase-1
MSPENAARAPATAGRRLGVLISGRGSNLQAIIDAVAAGELDATLALVISNVAGAAGLERARSAGVPTLVVDHRDFPTRAAFDGALVAALRAHDVALVCLAGFMRLLGPTFIDAFPRAILNIHPSLLPAFPGLHAQRQALRHGVKVSGATVHLVDAELDAGPIVLQATVPVRDDDTEESLAARILVEEHRIYPKAVARVLGGAWRIDGRRFIVEDRAPVIPADRRVPQSPRFAE